MVVKLLTNEKLATIDQSQGEAGDLRSDRGEAVLGQGEAGRHSGEALTSNRILELQMIFRQQLVCTITQKASTTSLLAPFSWMKAPISAFTFKNLLRHYAKQALSHGK